MNIDVNPPEWLRDVWDRLGIGSQDVAHRHLPFFQEATTLEVAVVTRSGREIPLTPAATKAWLLMQGTAQADGVEMYLISGFRSIQRQVELVETKLQQGQAIADVLTILAPPGCSEHHTGRAVDIGAPGFSGLDEAFEQSEAFLWLMQNASRFGFVLSFPRENRWGYQYEPWHWCLETQS